MKLVEGRRPLGRDRVPAELVGLAQEVTEDLVRDGAVAPPQAQDVRLAGLTALGLQQGGDHRVAAEHAHVARLITQLVELAHDQEIAGDDPVRRLAHGADLPMA